MERLALRVSGVRCIGTARALGRRLTFSKRSSDESGKCDLPRSENELDIAYGVLYEIPDSQREALDIAEGLGQGYKDGEIEVIDASSRVVKATAYFATEDAIDSKLVPFDWYHCLVLSGATQHELPADYVASIAAIPSNPDSQSNRKTRLEALRALENAGIPFIENHGLRCEGTALERWNSIDQFSGTFPVYNCAFLDILGYKERALAFFGQRFNLYGRINRALSNAVAAQNLTSALLNTSGFKFEIVSDSIVMTQPAPKIGLGPFLPFACQFASLLSLEGLLIRGGIAQGRHFSAKTEQGFDFLASEALQKAYVLESDKAINPRVLLDEDIIPILSSEERRLVIRENGDYILHFAHCLINRDGNNYADVHGEMLDLQAELNRNPSDSVKEKYQWVLDYYYWTLEQSPNWEAAQFESFKSGRSRAFSGLE